MATTTKRRKSGGAAAPLATPTAAQPSGTGPTTSLGDSQPAEREAPVIAGAPPAEPAFAADQAYPASSLPEEHASVATPSSVTPADERAIFMRRRAIALVGIALVAALAVVPALRLFAPSEPRPADTAPPALVSAPPAQAATVACSAIDGLPVFPGASCIEQKRDVDDGVNKLANTYVVSAPADDVRRFFEQAFPQGGWNLQDTDHDQDDQAWEYTVEQGDRKLKIQVKAQPVTQGSVTKFELAEK